MAGSTDSFWRSAQRWARSLSGPQAEPSPTGASASDPLPAGMALGGYRIERLLGRGAMGAMYLAVDPLTEAPVAIKTVALGRDTDGQAERGELRERFLREATAASRLQHPDIVTVHGAGEHDGLGFIVMELVAGSDLARYTRQARLLPEPVVLRIVARVADALAYAHAAGVVHRDVKPANVMVHLPTHQVKVTDFGIARLADSERTRTGLTFGTPAFMAPEQLAGAPADGRSDLYSLGVMLFQLLTGRLPYDAPSMGELLRAIAGSAPLDLRVVRPELPAALAEVVALAIEKRPESRYADGRQLAEDLRLVEAHWEAAQDVTRSPN
jgi:serine/threonine protein kinase